MHNFILTSPKIFEERLNDDSYWNQVNEEEDELSRSFLLSSGDVFGGGGDHNDMFDEDTRINDLRPPSVVCDFDAETIKFNPISPNVVKSYDIPDHVIVEKPRKFDFDQDAVF